MIWPRLVRNAQTPAVVTIKNSDINEYGEQETVLDAAAINCNYQEKTQTIITKDRREVKVTGTALFNGDICPKISDLSCGHVVIFGVEKQIGIGQKCRNPDGSVNYTMLDLT